MHFLFFAKALSLLKQINSGAQLVLIFSPQTVSLLASFVFVRLLNLKGKKTFRGGGQLGGVVVSTGLSQQEGAGFPVNVESVLPMSA